MKTWILGTAAGLLVSGAAVAADVDLGEPVLPADAVRTVLDAHSSDPVLEGGLERLGGIEWHEEEPDSFQDAVSPAPQALSASLLVSPATRPLDGAAPRACAEVYSERRQVRRWIERVGDLRHAIEARLRRAERVCRRHDDCDTTGLDGPLAELNAIVGNLRAYADRELAAKPDRLLTYRFHLDGDEGLALLRAGWRAVAGGDVERVRYHRSPWITGSAVTFGEEGALAGPPLAQPDGTWVVSRRLTATHACVNGQVFNLEFRSRLEQWPAGKGPAAGADGAAAAEPGLPERTELIRAISL